MNIAYLKRFTMIDYQGIAATLYLQGCNRRCSWCHNKDLIPIHASSLVSWDNYVIPFLKQRKHLLDAVVFSGGEPTIHSDLSEYMDIIINMGFKIGLHTNGDLLTSELASKCEYILLSQYNDAKIKIASNAKHLSTSKVDLISGKYFNNIVKIK